MDRVTKYPNGSYQWSCRIDTDYHRRSAVRGILGCAFLVAFILILYALMPSKPGISKELWVPMIPIGVILLIAAPLLYLQYSAADPHEQYVMEEDYIQSGYGKGAVLSNYKKTKEMIVAPDYLELIGEFRTNRIYVPAEDMDFVREYIAERLPETALISYT
ncbi:MAG: hypothetical protein Q4D81_06330 [Eubacteriales bacterium]|nr:hypothetical protein [Eubacteriales bacterium]